MCQCPLYPLEDSPRVCAISILPGKLIQIPGDQLCRAILSMGTQVPAEMQFRHVEKAKGHVESAVGLMEVMQGVVLCKRVALISVAREEGMLFGVQQSGCACPVLPLLSGMLLQRCMAGMTHRRHALLSLSSCSRRKGWAAVCGGHHSSGMCWSEATSLPLRATGAGESRMATSPWGCQGVGGAGGSKRKGK